MLNRTPKLNKCRSGFPLALSWFSSFLWLSKFMGTININQCLRSILLPFPKHHHFFHHSCIQFHEFLDNCVCGILHYHHFGDELVNFNCLNGNFDFNFHFFDFVYYIFPQICRLFFLLFSKGTFSLVCFVSLKESTWEARRNVFYFTSKALFILEIIRF